MGTHFDVVCAGIIVADHVAAPVDALPAAGHLVLTDQCFLSIGGCASNVAVDLAKMRVGTTICGCVGDDLFGQFARQVLENFGVDTSGLHVAPEAATSQTLIINVKGQDRRFIHLLGANQVFAAQHFSRDLISQARLLYVGGYLLMDRLKGEDLGEVFRTAQAAGVITVLDVVTPGPADYLPRLKPVLPFTDVFLPNNDESKLITGESDPVKQAEIFRALGVRTAVITCGGDGAVLVADSGRLRAGAFPVAFVDGTGGGDAFDAGFICGLLEGAGPERCLALGSALGASCVQRSGATDGVFSRDQANAFLQSHSLRLDPIP
jgi:sugar/nucleoside kinase (ribokinase family)